MSAVVLAGSKVFGVDLELVQGATNTLRFRYSTGPEGYAVPYDFTGCVAHGQLRRGKQAADVWLDLSPYVVMDAHGYVTITVPHSVTEGADWDKRDSGVWDLELTMPDGTTRRRLVEGVVTVSHEVTRA